MAIIGELFRCAVSAEDEMERRFCLTRLGDLLQMLLELKLLELWRRIEDLRVGPPKITEVELEGLRDDAVLMKDALTLRDALKDPDPEPIVLERALKVLHRFLEEELRGIEDALKGKIFEGGGKL